MWELQRVETELWKEPPEPLQDEIDELVMKDKFFWEGSATELVSLIKVEIQSHIITRKLNILSGRLYVEHGIYYKSNRTHDGRKIRFWKDDTETASHTVMERMGYDEKRANIIGIIYAAAPLSLDGR